MQAIAQLKELLSKPQKVVITMHFKPDADALGSALAWSLYLQKLGHQVSVISPSDYPKFLAWMPGNETVIDYLTYANRGKAERLIAGADAIFCLDFNALSRVHEMEKALRNAGATLVMIDHHLRPDDFAQISFSDSTAAATAQMIYKIIIEMGDEALIDIPMAECLYAGIMTDTGSFKYDSTTPEVLRIAANLRELGIDATRIHRLIYDTNSVDKLKFLGYVLSQKMVVLPEYHVAYIAITDQELKQYKSQTGDTEGFVNYALSIQGIVMAVIIVDRSDMIKMSFRSINDFAVNELASKYFEGGGHRNAAGGRSAIGLEKTIEKLLGILPEYQTGLSENVMV
jgi:phosphoesterase RecJ-like protein